MSWRIVVVHNTAKLDLQLQYLVVRSEMKTQKIHISEIALLLVEATSVSLTVGLLGMDFSRSQDCPINAALNYGYSLMLSAINREIVMNGYITQLGLFHDNMFNQFNLGSDLMEPYRVLVDRKVCEMKPIEFEHEQKMKLVALLNEEVIMEGKHFVILNAIKQYVKSVFDALNESDIAQLSFYSYEL